MNERKAAGYGLRDRRNPEDLISLRPGDAAEDRSRVHVEGMHPADALVDVKAGGVLFESGYHAGRTYESDIADEAESARPARESRDRPEPPILNVAKLTVATVIDPDLSPMQPRRMWPCEASRDYVAASPRKDNATTINREVLVPGPPPR